MVSGFSVFSRIKKQETEAQEQLGPSTRLQEDGYIISIDRIQPKPTTSVIFLSFAVSLKPKGADNRSFPCIEEGKRECYQVI